MHEMGLAAELARIAQQAAGPRSIVKMTIVVGGLAGVNRDSLLFGLEAVWREKGQPLPAIVIRDEAAGFACACGTIYENADPLAACPACGGYERTITKGKDCMLETIEVDHE
jgi:Zn finger protein HypA/HybF involved in hydrogenase expression